MHTLVTGGAGFIGSHVVRRLLKLGHTVRVVDDLSTGFKANLDGVLGDVDFMEADLRDPAVSTRAVAGCEVVFHIAALASVPRSMKDPGTTHDVNVNGTFHLLEAARQAGVRRVVYSASSSAYGDTPALPKVETAETLPRSPYAASKLAGEHYVLSYARAGLVEGVALRYFNVFGPRQDPNGPYAAIIPLVFSAALHGTTLRIFGDGEQTRDFTFIDNVVKANVLAATVEGASGSMVNVGAGDRTSLNDLVRVVQEITGRTINVAYDAPRAGDVRDSLASMERAREVLNYTPDVSLRDGLKELWQWEASQAAAASS